MIFLIREAFANLRRHSFMTAAAVTTIAAALALLGAFLVTFYEVDTATQHAAADFEMRVFCRLGIKNSERNAVRGKLRALPGVARVQFSSRQEIWAEQSRKAAIDVSGIPNPMNDTFIVKLSEPGKAGDVAQTVRQWDEVFSVELPETEIGRVVQIARFFRNIGAISAVVLLAGALLVVSNTVRISVFARRREIKIMQIVGATPWFIRFPLFLEGIIHGLAGGLLACVVLYVVGQYVGGLIRDTVPLLLPYGKPIDMLAFCGAIVGAGALIGASGSLLSIRRYLRVTG